MCVYELFKQSDHSAYANVHRERVPAFETDQFWDVRLSGTVSSWARKILAQYNLGKLGQEYLYICMYIYIYVYIYISYNIMYTCNII